jgi:hypothetical protein
MREQEPANQHRSNPSRKRSQERKEQFNWRFEVKKLRILKVRQTAVR